MPRDGSGNYGLPPAFNPVVGGTDITDTWANTTLTDIAVAITGSLPTNGEVGPTANLPMSGFKHTGASAASTSGQYLVFGQALVGSTGTFSGLITSPVTPTDPTHVANKAYVDASVASTVAGVASFNGRLGVVTLVGTDVTTALGFTPVGLTATQTLTNKTLTSPIITTPTVTAPVNVGNGSTLPARIVSTVSTAGVHIDGSADGAGAYSIWYGSASSTTPNTVLHRSNTHSFQDQGASPLLTLAAGGATFVGSVSTATAPTTANHLANKAYVDSVAAGGGGVTSFNTRTGAVTLSSGDVTGALGFTPVTATAPTLTSTVHISNGSTTPGRIASTVSTAGLQIDGSNDGSGAFSVWYGSSNSTTPNTILHRGNTQQFQDEGGTSFVSMTSVGAAYSIPITVSGNRVAVVPGSTLSAVPVGTILAGDQVNTGGAFTGVPMLATVTFTSTSYISCAPPSGGTAELVQYGTWRGIGRVNGTFGLWQRVS